MAREGGSEESSAAVGATEAGAAAPSGDPGQQQPEQQRREGALTCLMPDIITRVITFLRCEDIRRMRESCAGLRANPKLLPVCLFIRHRPDCRLVDEETRIEALSALLSVVAGGSVKTLELPDERAIPQLRAAVDSMPLDLPCQVQVLSFKMRMSDAKKQLEHLQTVGYLVSHPWWSASLDTLRIVSKRAGALRIVLPNLQRAGSRGLRELALEACDFEEVSLFKQFLLQCMEEGKQNKERPCRRLRTLALGLVPCATKRQADADELHDVLCCMDETLLEGLLLLGPLYNRACVDRTIQFLMQRQHHLTHLRVLNLVSADIAEGDDLLRALARGSVPMVEHFMLGAIQGSDAAWEAVRDAMKAEGSTCFRRMKQMRFQGAFKNRGQLESLMRGIGEGHGCPRLELFTLIAGGGADFPMLQGQCGEVLAHAFKPRHALPSLTALTLALMDMHDFHHLSAAWHNRPPTRIRKLHMQGCMTPGLPGFGEALTGGLAGLKDFGMEAGLAGGGEGCLPALAKALANGAGSQLRAIEWSQDMTPELISAFLRALVQGACPKLNSFVHKQWARIMPRHATEQQYDMEALDSILRGKAACSSTIEDLWLHSCMLDRDSIRSLAHTFSQPDVIQLRILNISLDGGADLEDIAELLHSLDGPASADLRSIWLYLGNCDEEKARAVLKVWTGLICDGAFARMSPTASTVTYGPMVQHHGNMRCLWSHQALDEWRQYVNGSLLNAYGVCAMRRREAEMAAKEAAIGGSAGGGGGVEKKH